MSIGEHHSDLKTEIQIGYWDRTLTEGKAPKSVYALCKFLELDEADFYKCYSCIEAVESTFWEFLVNNTVETLEKDEDYAMYGFDQKLLAFFFTFFAFAERYRSRLQSCFPHFRIDACKKLSLMKKACDIYANSLIEQAINNGEIADRKQLNRVLTQGLFEHLRVTILFYINDDSADYQDTDAFIEKTVNLVIQSVSHGVIDSVIDIARFLVRKTSIVKE